MNVITPKKTSPGKIMGGNLQLNNTLGAIKNPKVVGTYLKLDCSNDPLTDNLTIQNTGSVKLTLISDDHTNAEIILQRATDSDIYSDWKIGNVGAVFSIANRTTAGWTSHFQIQTDGAVDVKSNYLDMNTHKIINVTDPTSDQDAATKKYVDDAIPTDVTVRTASITVENCTDSEDLSIFFTNKAITISEMRAVISGSSSPSITWTIRHSTDRSAAGNEVVTGGTTTTSTTTGSDVTSFNDATIPADSFVWFETTADSGTVTELHVTLVFTED